MAGRLADDLRTSAGAERKIAKTEKEKSETGDALVV